MYLIREVELFTIFDQNGIFFAKIRIIFKAIEWYMYTKGLYEPYTKWKVSLFLKILEFEKKSKNKMKSFIPCEKLSKKYLIKHKTEIHLIQITY